MGKKQKTRPRRPNGQRRPQPVPTFATVRRSDGGNAVRLELALQPEGALRLADFLVNAVLKGRNRGK